MERLIRQETNLSNGLTKPNPIPDDKIFVDTIVSKINENKFLPTEDFQDVVFEMYDFWVLNNYAEAERFEKILSRAFLLYRIPYDNDDWFHCKLRVVEVYDQLKSLEG